MFPNLQSLSEEDEYKDNPAPSGRRRSSVVPPSLQFLVDQDSQQASNEPAEWEKSWDQTTENPELCDFLDRVSSRDPTDPDRQGGDRMRRGS
ncbi:hypothetical protein AtubIFM55763_009541 [Aspergillus tubingensis]|uniref:Uncharacterized protein n=1 Tax=Aspergillus tubingensis TaxID=5068 RepID=A0A9W6ACT3_ASPTU|nr:hypothetical protein AtubIFM55763_009541 [Aspergillus tubingensis]GLA80626.1 hypothetical protein AtubIFM56815_001451 [Aspergillus tubingensis]GLB02740.1 hypothetical protein AtubIFM57258_006204 [Aspergillus tubingensis]GLB22476.1 hypothetical protein AtubIFM61612_003043 [Aspergillus tubingensis]